MAVRLDPIDLERSRTAADVVHQRGAACLTVLLVLLTMSTVAVASVAAAPVTGPAADTDGSGMPVALDQCTTTAEEAVAAQNRSGALVRELQQLADESPVVDDEAVQSATFHLDRGESHFRNSRYCAAVDKFRVAENQARAELERAYHLEATLLLNASAAQLADTAGSGSDVAVLRTRIEDARGRLASADSLEATRSAYRQASELHGAVADQSPGAAVWLARNIVLSTVGAGFVLIGIGAVVGSVGRSMIGRGRERVQWNR